MLITFDKDRAVEGTDALWPFLGIYTFTSPPIYQLFLETMSLMTTYPLVSSSYMLPVPCTTTLFLFWPNLWPKWWNISQPLYTYDRERGVKSQAPFSRPQERRKPSSLNFVRGGDAAIQEGAKQSQGTTQRAEQLGWSRTVSGFFYLRVIRKSP
jgi:hypothetical protein